MATSKKRYTKSGKLSPSELKAFRHQVSLLKKQGKIRKSIDARSARPSRISNGRSLAEILNAENFPAKRKKSTTKSSKKAASNQAENVDKSKPNLAPIGRAISVRDFPLKHKTLMRALEDLRSDEDRINAMKRHDERFAFRILGTDSLVPFRDIGLLLDYLQESDGIQALYTKRGPAKEVFDSLQIIRWNKTAKEWIAQRKVRGKSLKKAQAEAARRRRKQVS